MEEETMNQISPKIYEKERRIHNKLARLQSKNHINNNKETNCPRNFYTRIKNMTDITLSKKEEQMLQKELKHTLKDNNKKALKQLAIDKNITINNNIKDKNKAEKCRNKCFTAIRKE